MKKLFQFSKIIRGLSSGSKFLLGSVFISSFAFIYFAVAAPPTSPYAPGETLAPICSPGDANCTVVTPAVSGDNADITSLSTLTFIDINGGTIDGAVIGVSDPAAAVFTNLQSGQDGSDGQFTIYSEQGAADYSIIFQPNASMTQSTTYVLPPDDGSVNEFLMTNGSGELIWQNVSVVGGNTLDQAYDEGGAGIGRTLAVDSGAIRFFGSNAADETLEITNSGNGGALFIENIGSGLSLRVDDEASDTSPFVIDAAGNVGIGTDSPGNKLEIVNTSAATETIPLAIKNKDSTDGTITTLGFSSFSDGTITGKIQHENLAASQYALKFGLWTGLAVNPLMTIINNGNIGIGTTDPGTLLQLEKDGDAYLTLKNATDENTDGGAETRIIFEDHENAALAQIQGSHDGTGVDTKGDLIFSTHSGSALAEAMRIDSSGNVGIGTDAPGAKLEVSEIIAPGSDNFMLKLYNPTHATDSRSGLLFEAGTSAASAYIQSKTDGAGDMDIDIDGSILIKATGNIGIGTVSPGTLLQLEKDGDAYLTLKNATDENSDGGAETRIIFEDHENAALAQIQGSHDGTGVDTKGDLIFSTHSGSALNEAMRIDSEGNVSVAAGNLSLTGTVTNHLLLPSNNDATTPTLAFGDGDSGFYESADDQLMITLGGSLKWKIFTSAIMAFDPNGIAIFNSAPSATVPTLIPNRSDLDTGIGRAAADQLSLIAGGVEGIRINTAASGVNYLDITPSATTNAVQIATAGTDTNIDLALMPKGTGNVGIGTDAPLTKLDIYGTAFFRDTTYIGDGKTIGSYSGNEAKLKFTNAIGSQFTSATAGTIMTIHKDGNVGIGTDAPDSKLHLIGDTVALTLSRISTPMGGLLAFTDQNKNIKARMGIDIVANNFFIDDGTTTRLFIKNSTGNVGIGTIAPGTLLQLEKDGDAYLTLKNATDENSDGGAETRIIFEDHENAALAQIQGSHDGTGVDTKGDLIFSTHSGSALDEAMRIDSSGNVGIGTDAPGAKLDVYEVTELGGTLGDSQLISEFANKMAGNSFYHREWTYRDATGTTWLTGRLHDAISIDTSYDTPGTNTKVWWERDPANNIQSWGNGASTYMTINNGNIGIGTTDPGTLLQLEKDGDAYLTLKNATNENTDGGAETRIIFEDHENAALAQIQGSHDGAENDTKGDLIFSTHSGSALAEAMRIDSSGNVGIGTDAPSYKLEVVGDIAINSSTNKFYMRNAEDNSLVDIIQFAKSGSQDSLIIGRRSGLFQDSLKLIGGNGDVYIMTTDGVNGDIIFGETTAGDNTYTPEDEWMRITSAGLVGIGTTDPQNKLDIEGGAVIGATYSGTSTAPTNGLLVEGNVGIGTDAPSQQLTVAGINDESIFYIKPGTGGVDQSGYLSVNARARFGYDGSRSAVVIDDKGLTGSTANKPIVFDTGGSERMRIDSSGNVGIGTDSPGAKLEVQGSNSVDMRLNADWDAQVSFADSGTVRWIIGRDNTDNAFKISYDSTDFNAGNVLTINQAGNIGIGTVSPGTLLQLEKDGDAYLTLKNATDENTDGGAETRIIFEDHENAALAQIQGSHDGTGVDTKGDLIFSTHSGSALAEAMRIDSSGRVGIGGDPGTAKLYVNGNVGIGTTNPGGGTGSFVLTLANSSAAPTLLANTTHLYSSAGEGYWMDAAGNTTLQTPHDSETGEWIFSSSNSNTEKTLEIRMEQLTKEMDRILGGGFVIENGLPYYTGEGLLDGLIEDIQDLKQEVNNINSLALGGGIEEFAREQSANGTLVFEQGVFFKGHVVFNGDTVGAGKIEAGEELTEIEFEQKYVSEPIVTATFVGENILDADFKFTIVDKSENGFTIKIKPVQEYDLEFNWHAFGTGEKDEEEINAMEEASEAVEEIAETADMEEEEEAAEIVGEEDKIVEITETEEVGEAEAAEEVTEEDEVVAVSEEIEEDEVVAEEVTVEDEAEEKVVIQDSVE